MERSIEVSRPAATLFTLLNGFKPFSAWSPWSERDPHTVYGYSGPDYGIGARMSWTGDPRLVGSGSQEIVESTPMSTIRIQMKLDQMGRAYSTFRVDSADDNATVTWGFDMNLVENRGFLSGLMFRYLGLFFDRWIGADYERGLVRLKHYAETFPAADFSGLEVEIVTVAPMEILYVSMSRRESAAGITVGLAAAYREITALMELQSIERQSPPMAISRGWDTDSYEFDAAIPAKTAGVQLTGNVRAGRSPAGRVARVIHRGSYAGIPAAYARLAAWMAVHGLVQGGVSWEQYISNPGQTESGQAVTHIFYSIGSPVMEDG